MSSASIPRIALKRARMASLSTAASMIRCATWMFFGPSSRAIACATARSPNFAAAKAANPLPPRRDAVAPVKRMVPRPRRLPPDQKACVAGELPGLEEQLLGGLEQRLVDVRAGVEQADLDRSDLVLDAGEQRLDFRLLPRIDAESVGLVLGVSQFVDELL